MEAKNIVSLLEITKYFDFWRQAKEECASETDCKKLFTSLRDR